MPVRFVDQTYSSGVKTSVSADGFQSATATIKYAVFLDGLNPTGDSEATVKADPRIPRELSRHPLFYALFCNGVSVDRRGPLHFEVTAEYMSWQYKDSQQPPFQQPTQISFFSITSEEPIDENVNGNPIVTPNGEPLYGVTRPISDLGIRLAKNFLTFDPASFYTYIDCVNSDTYIGFAPGILRVASISADQQMWADAAGNQIPFFAVQVEIHARKPYRTTAQKAWYKRVRNEGFMVRLNNRIYRATDANKEPVASPVQLDLTGAPLSNQTNATWLEFQVFSTVSFASMGF